MSCRVVKMNIIMMTRREKDKTNGMRTAKFALKHMCEKHNIGADTASQAKPAKKCRVEKVAPVAATDWAFLYPSSAVRVATFKQIVTIHLSGFAIGKLNKSYGDF